MTDRYDVVIIGGGPAGSTAAAIIAHAGYSVCLLEKRRFPREVLCGEFLSHEVVTALCEMGLESQFLQLRPNPITRFTLLPGRNAHRSVPLDFPAYGIKRGKFDEMLLNVAAGEGVNILQPAEVHDVVRKDAVFEVHYRDENGTRAVQGSWVVGAYGKASSIGMKISKSTLRRTTKFIGVKFHIPRDLLTNMQDDEIVVASGRSMYCGMNSVGDGTATLCFLESRTQQGIAAHMLLRELAESNPQFATRVTQKSLDFIREARVYGTGNLVFGQRDPVQNGVFNVGDAAGLIAPLAGDGIGIALQQARLLAQLFTENRGNAKTRNLLEAKYRRASARLLSRRMKTALVCQTVMLSGLLRPLIPPLLGIMPGLLGVLVHATRGTTPLRSPATRAGLSARQE
jgi:flavin-dependent dehydrogenase